MFDMRNQVRNFKVQIYRFMVMGLDFRGSNFNVRSLCCGYGSDSDLMVRVRVHGLV